ncbi:MAG: epoxyqueuosine reductase QueH [Lentisphaerae bacterium]|nr:epoxyqueuosine reductase QueH [Lentisphaerota bacterium]
MSKRLLLHICCAPCACGCLEQLRLDDWEFAFYFSNSNLNSAEEFQCRYAAAETLAAAENVHLYCDPYDHATWLERTAELGAEPERGRRCAICFEWSLSRTALAAEAMNFDAFATSLTVSPHKPSKLIFEIGKAFEKFTPYDFKKRDGFLKGNRRAKELELYRQQYCGCEFSYRDRFNQA